MCCLRLNVLASFILAPNVFLSTQTPFDFFTKRTDELRRKNVFSASSSIVVGFVVLDFLLERLHEYDDDDARNDSSSNNNDDDLLLLLLLQYHHHLKLVMVKGQGKVGLHRSPRRKSFQNQSLMMMLSRAAVNTVAVIVAALFIDRRGRLEVNGSVGDCIFRKRSVLDDHHKGGGFGRPFHSSSLLKKIAEHTTKQQEQRREQSTTAGASGASETAAPEDDAQKEQRAKGFVASLDKNIVDNVLNTRHVQNLRERLDEIKYTKEFITIDKFAELCKESGCTEKKPEEYVDIMKNAGLVIQIEDYVYLEPQNITRAVINALPGVPPRIYGVSDAELRKLNEEYDQMREKVVLAEKKAARRATQLLYGGFIVLIAQLAVFVRFTYVEFSWDVMEPISYFVGLANVIMGYMYFMYTQRDFSFGTWQNQMMQSAMDRQLKTGKFDVTKYEQMARKLRRRNMIR